MAFWGIEVTSGNPITHSCEKARGRLRVSQATLGIGKATTKTIVQCNVGERSPVLLCVLQPSKTETCHLDLEFEEADDVVFSVIGPRSVYLTGYFVRGSMKSNVHTDTESYGVDIDNSQTDRSGYWNDEDKHEDGFINDGELPLSPQSPVLIAKGVGEVSLENDKTKGRNGRSKQLEKKFPVIESDGDEGSPEDEDASAFKNRKAENTSVCSADEKAAQVLVDLGDEAKGGTHSVSNLKDDHIKINGNREGATKLPLNEEMTAPEDQTNDIPNNNEVETLEDNQLHESNMKDAIIDENTTDQMQLRDLATKLPLDKDTTALEDQTNDIPNNNEVETLEDNQLHKNNTKDAIIDENTTDQMQRDIATKLPLDEEMTAPEDQTNDIPNNNELETFEDNQLHENNMKDAIIDENTTDQMQHCDLATKLPLDEEFTALEDQTNDIPNNNEVETLEDNQLHENNTKYAIIVENTTDQMQLRDLANPKRKRKGRSGSNEKTSEVHSDPKEDKKHEVEASTSLEVDANHGVSPGSVNGKKSKKRKYELRSKVTDAQGHHISKNDLLHVKNATNELVAADEEYSTQPALKTTNEQTDNATELPLDEEMTALEDQTNDIPNTYEVETLKDNPLHENNTKDTVIDENTSDQMQLRDLANPKRKRKGRPGSVEKTSKVHSDHKQDKKHEVEASTSLEVDANHGVSPGSVNGKKSKRRYELRSKVTDAQGIGGKSHRISKIDLLHVEIATNELVAVDEEYSTEPALETTNEQTHNNISSNPALLANDSQPAKKVSTKKKTRSRQKNLNAGMPEAEDDKETTPMAIPIKYDDVPVQTRTLSNGLTIEELETGQPDGKVATHGKKVKIYYNGMLRENMRVFDSNVGGSAFKYRLGDEQLIEGWNIGIEGMHVGGKRRLIIPPSLGFGSHGIGENVPPESWLVYDIELVDIRR